MKKRLLAFISATVISLTGCADISIIKKEKPAPEKPKYILDSDTRVITEIDLSKLNDTELEYAYEEIFARHGKIYPEANYEKYFNAQDWYSPNPSFDSSNLSNLETENANFIYDYIAAKEAEATPAPTENTQTQIQVQTIPVQVAEPVHNDVNYYYVYRAGDSSYIIPDSSSRALLAGELMGFSPEMLALIRNEIYARHGYIFSKKKYAEYFSSKTWYRPNPNFNESMLSSVEKQNIYLIKSLED